MMNEKADRRHERRILSMEDFALLVEAAENRPLAERSKHALIPATKDKLVWLGRTRAMTYHVLMFTGFRYSELRSIKLAK